jgi:hypothetical protein
MVRLMARAVFGWRGTLAALVVFVAATVAAYWPASWWMDVRAVLALDSVHGAEVVLVVDRDVHREFYGEWAVAVRRRAADGDNWQLVCTARGAKNYLPGDLLPDPLTLDWWTGGQCPNPPPGDILISTVWRIEAGFARDRILHRDSNIFRVHEAP